MSSYSNLYIGGYSFLGQPASVFPESMILFRENDKKTSVETVDGEDWENYEYSNTVKNIKQRLEVVGYTLKNIEVNFNRIRKEEVSNLKDSESEYTHTAIEILEKYDLIDWISAFKEIRELDKHPFFFKDKEQLEKNSPLVGYILDFDDDKGPYNFPGNFLSLTRIFLETCKEDDVVRLDISALVSAGWYRADQKVCEDTLDFLKSNYPVSEKIIILTEGSTDKYFLEKSLSILYPHLVGYYSFMNFETSKAQGGAGSLIANVKSFIGSGIINKVVAIADNDTAAASALKSLKNITLPTNIKVLQYPSINLVTDYPTLGPTGTVSMNVNGLACSIEMYLGKDVLEKNGKLRPIQWKGFDQGVGKYQGEVLEKDAIQDEFRKKLSVCELDSTRIAAYDWDGIRAILETIFKAFH